VSGELPNSLEGADAWIVSRLHSVIAEVDALYEKYEFAKIADLLYHFAWDEVCDWYLELSKVSLAGPSADTTKRVLGEVLDTLLRLLHPYVPFVTEALWTVLTGAESLVVAAWPSADPARVNPLAEKAIVDLQTVINEVRRFRSDQGIKPSQRIPARLTGATDEVSVRTLLRLEQPAEGFAATASLTTSTGVTVELDLSGAIDIGAERARLTKDLAAAQKELAQNSAKLGNEAFTAKAPADVIAKVQGRLAAATADVARIESALAALPTA
jgi:valyl-tRNA synthetase